jgi:hypothetical protein
MKARTFLLSVVIALTSSASSEARQRYVLVQQMERTFEVRDNRKDSVTMTIKSVAGKPAYGIQCHSGEVDAPSLDDYNFQWSGDFECRLVSYPASGYTTLFTESTDQERDWLSRARFFSSELRGSCASVPELGRRRSFKLRGMKITLEVIDPKFTDNPKFQTDLDSLKLKISVERDATAWRLIAAITPIPHPIPAGCDPSHIPPVLNWGDRR